MKLIQIYKRSQLLFVAIFCTMCMMAQQTEEELFPGSTIDIGGVTYVAGHNLISNPSFEEVDPQGFYPGWTNGCYENLSSIHFDWSETGGSDEGAFITATMNAGAASEGSIATRWTVSPYEKYYFSFHMKGLTRNMDYVPVLTLTSIQSSKGGQNEGKTEATMLLGKTDYQTGIYGYGNYGTTADDWTKTAIFFDSDKDIFLQFNARYLYDEDYVSFDDFQLLQLYPVTEDGYAVVREQYDALLIEVQTWADDSLMNDFPDMYLEFTGDISYFTEDIPTDVETLVDYLYIIKELFEEVKAERQYNKLVREGMTLLQPYMDNCVANEDILLAHSNLAGIYSSLKDSWGYLTGWLEEGEFHIGDNQASYMLMMDARKSVLSLDAVIRLNQAIVKAEDNARPSDIEDAKGLYSNLTESELLADELYDYIPEIDAMILKLEKVWKIRIHMGDNEGSFAERLALYVDSFDEVEWLLVTGCMNAADMQVLGSLNNLIHLDLAGVTSMKINHSVKLHIDVMDNDCRPDVDLSNASSADKCSLTYQGNAVWSMNSFTMNYGFYNDAQIKGCCLFNEGNMGASNVSFRYISSADSWDFITFPFNVSLASISACYPNQDIAIRSYSGENRAAGDMNNTWIEVGENDMLQAGKGYIVRSPMRFTNQNTSYPWSVWNIPAQRDEHLNDIFTTENVTVALEEFKSDDTFAHNRNWNFIGNPYPCFLPLSAIDFEGPVTVWNRTLNTYDTYNALDGDSYLFAPGEAFFVQCPLEGEKSVIFRSEGRTLNESHLRQSRRLQKIDSNGRHIYDLVVECGDKSDHTRIVLDENASVDYEIGRDAAKFLSEDTSVPQLFSCTNGVDYAINELLPSEQLISLGMQIPTDGSYTLKAEEAYSSMRLYDAKTDEWVMLNKDDQYVFDAQKGRQNGRFFITFPDEQTSVVTLAKESDKRQNWYDIAGRKIAHPEKGLYISDGKKCMLQ